MNSGVSKPVFRIFRSDRWTAVALALGATVGGLAAADSPFKVLHSFSDSDGSSPSAGLIIDASGNLYGTTQTGGSSNTCIGGCGTVFTIKTGGTGFRLLHSFSASDGSNPVGNLILDADGILYGTTRDGGSGAGCNGGCGTVFSVHASGAGFKTLHSFSLSGNDGAFPWTTLILDKNGMLYGTTSHGGSSSSCTGGCGTVFKIKTDGTGFGLLHKFSKVDGDDPLAGLVMDADGEMYGTTSGSASCFAGVDCGTVFKVNTSGADFKVLHSFSNGDGGDPGSALILDNSGELYGTTVLGGSNPSCSNCGTIFKINTSGSDFKVLRSLSIEDGLYPQAALILDASGNLYGTARSGGASAAAFVTGFGTIFELKTDGTGYTVLHSFSGLDGGSPESNLLLDGAGSLYGSTAIGGNGFGTIYKLVLQTIPPGRRSVESIAAMAPVPTRGRKH